MSDLTIVIIVIILAIVLIAIVYIVCGTIIIVHKDKNGKEQTIAETFAKSNRNYDIETAHLSVKNDENNSKFTYSDKSTVSLSKILHTVSSFLSNFI